MGSQNHEENNNKRAFWKFWKRNKNEGYGKPKFVWDKENDPEYVRNRLGDFIDFFEEKRKESRDKERRYQYLIITFGAAIPIVNVPGLGAEPWSSIASSILGGAVVVLTSILQFEKWHEKWVHFKLTASKLRNEYYMWKSQNSKNSEPDSISYHYPKDLVDNCEKIIMDESVEYASYFDSQNRPGDNNSKLKSENFQLKAEVADLKKKIDELIKNAMNNGESKHVDEQKAS